MVLPNNSWLLASATLGAHSGHPYSLRELSRGQLLGVVPLLSPDVVFHLRFDCAGQAPTTLTLFVNGSEAGRAVDQDGLGPGNAGFAGGSTTGELAFDNLVVTALS